MPTIFTLIQYIINNFILSFQLSLYLEQNKKMQSYDARHANHNPRASLPVDLFPKTLVAGNRLQNMNCIEEGSQKLGAVYLGDIISTMKYDLLASKEISAILSCLPDAPNANSFNKNAGKNDQVVRKSIAAKDHPQYPLSRHFEETFEFIENARCQRKNILVHCHAGLSRSAAILCAYFMRKNKWSVDQAINYIKQKRQRIRPNEGFIRMLKEYQIKIKGGAMQSRIMTSRPSIQNRNDSLHQRYEQQKVAQPINNQSRINCHRQSSIECNNRLRSADPRYCSPKPMLEKYATAVYNQKKRANQNVNPQNQNISITHRKQQSRNQNSSINYYAPTKQQQQFHQNSSNSSLALVKNKSLDASNFEPIKLIRHAESDKNEQRNKKKFGAALKNKILTKIQNNYIDQQSTFKQMSMSTNNSIKQENNSQHRNLFSSFSNSHPYHHQQQQQNYRQKLNNSQTFY